MVILLLPLLLLLGTISGSCSEQAAFGDTDSNHARYLQSLEQIWFLSDIGSEVEIRQEESAVDMTFLFSTSDAIEDNMVQIDIFDAETCSMPILLEQSDMDADDASLLLSDMFSVTNPVSTDATGIGLGSRDWAAEVGVTVPDDLFDAGAFNDTASNILVVGERNLLTFCVHIATTLPPGGDDAFSGLPVTQVALVAEIIVSDDDSLSVELFDFEFPPIMLPAPPPRAKATFCDQDNNELATQPLILEGDVVRICVVPPEDGNYTMGTVDYFQYEEYIFQQPDGDDNSTVVPETPLFQVAIMPGGRPSFNQLTEFSCTAEVCVIESLLFASFFEPNTKIVASGYATFYATDEDTGNTTVVGEGDENNDEEVLESYLFLRFETLLQITNVLPSTSRPTTAPSATPTFSSSASLPSQSPSTTEPSSMPSSYSSPSSSASCWHCFTISSCFSWGVASLLLPPPFFALLL
jgi:hypothetical protein